MNLRWRSLAAYATLRMPLAWLELPLFILLPAFYAGTLGVNLASVGVVLFAVRAIDAVADPWIGAAIDRHRLRYTPRRWIAWGLPPLVLGFAGLFLPPVRGEALLLWLAIISTLTYLAYSAVSIAYQSWGAELGGDDAGRTRITATREVFGVAGVLGASALMSPEHIASLVAGFAVLAAVAGVALTFAPGSERVRAPEVPDTAGWRQPLRVRAFRWLFAAFMLNGIATAVPATLVLFFVGDVLGVASQDAAVFLAVYFLSGAVGMPLWVAAARRLGLRNAWLLGIGASVAAFAGTLGLGHGDTAAFMAICVVTGLALGSDLAIPAALLATVIARERHAGLREGSCFGLWNLGTKLSLAAAAGLALPMLDRLGYAPGAERGVAALALVYAALPCALKLAAGAALMVARLPTAGSNPEDDHGVHR